MSTARVGAIVTLTPCYKSLDGDSGLAEAVIIRWMLCTLRIISVTFKFSQTEYIIPFVF
jgi:hypothetical protein